MRPTESQAIKAGIRIAFYFLVVVGRTILNRSLDPNLLEKKLMAEIDKDIKTLTKGK